jgi:hypothetical protein
MSAVEFCIHLKHSFRIWGEYGQKNSAARNEMLKKLGRAISMVMLQAE